MYFTVFCYFPNTINTLSKELLQSFTDNAIATIKKEIWQISFVITYSLKHFIERYSSLGMTQ